MNPKISPFVPEDSDRPRIIRGAGLVLAFLLLAAAGMGKVLIHADQVLDFNDGNIESALSPALACPQAMLRIWDNQFFFGLGSKLFSVCSASLGESLFGPHHYRREFVALWLALVGSAFYWMLRQYRLSRISSAIAAGAVMLGGSCYSFSVLGLTTRAGTLGFTALAVGFLERGRRTDSWIPYILGGGCLGLAISEVPDIGALLALSTAALFAWTHWPRPMAGAPWGRLGLRLGVYVLSSIVLAWQTIGVMFATQVQGVQQGGAEDPAARYEWATQWSLPPEETWNLVSGTFYGTTARSQEAPYRGRMGRSAGWETTRQGFRNFSLTGHHLGVVPSILLLAAGALLLGGASNRRRLAIMALAGAGISLLLAMGKFTPFYRLIYALPYFSTIRNPEKWMLPFLLFAVLAIALAIDALLDALSNRGDPAETKRIRRGTLIACAAIGGIALVLMFITITSKTAFLGRMQAEGYGDLAEPAWSTAIVSCLKVIVLSGGLALALIVLPRVASIAASRRAPIFAATLGILTALDLFAVNSDYVAGRSYAYLKILNPLAEFIAQHRGEGRFKMLPPDHPLLNNIRMSHVQASGCDLFDPVSVSRMPTDYATLFDAVKANPMRLWELGAVRYFITLPGGAQQLEQTDGNRGRIREVLAAGLAQAGGGVLPVSDAPASQQVLRIAEFSGARPKFSFAVHTRTTPETPDGERDAMARMISADFDPAAEAVVHGDPAPDASPKSHIQRIVRDEPALAAVEVETPAAALLTRAVKYDPDWRVRIDGSSAALRRVNSLFQGVVVPPGQHRVEFEYRPDRTPLAIAVAGRIGWIGLWIVGLVRRRPAVHL